MPTERRQKSQIGHCLPIHKCSPIRQCSPIRPGRAAKLVSTFHFPSLATHCLVLLAIAATLGSTAHAQFGLINETQQRTNFEFQARGSFEPKLLTNFEPALPTTFGFQATRSATNVRMADRLNQLQPRLKEERKFIAEVIQLVEQGHLPEPLVNESFFYAIQRYGGPMPFPYFERILRIQAERLQAQVPTFDRTIYSKERFTPQIFNQ